VKPLCLSGFRAEPASLRGPRLRSFHTTEGNALSVARNPVWRASSPEKSRGGGRPALAGRGGQGDVSWHPHTTYYFLQQEAQNIQGGIHCFLLE